jgi:hypothetical protein
VAYYDSILEIVTEHQEIKSFLRNQNNTILGLTEPLKQGKSITLCHSPFSLSKG